MLRFILLVFKTFTLGRDWTLSTSKKKIQSTPLTPSEPGRRCSRSDRAVISSHGHSDPPRLVLSAAALPSCVTRSRPLLIGCRRTGAGRSPRCWNRCSSWSCKRRWGQKTERLSGNTKMDDDLFQLRQLPWVDTVCTSNASCPPLFIYLSIYLFVVSDFRPWQRVWPTRRPLTRTAFCLILTTNSVTIL